ncbi:unnamed protein product, partial [marine sediment metagenome]
HSFAATGAQEIIISSLAIRDNIIPPTINLNNPDPECDLDYTLNIATPFLAESSINFLINSSS